MSNQTRVSHLNTKLTLSTFTEYQNLIKTINLIAIQNKDTIVFNADISSLVNFQASGSKEVEGNTQLLEIINSIKPKTDSLKIIYQKSVGTVEESIVLERIRKRYDALYLSKRKI